MALSPTQKSAGTNYIIWSSIPLANQKSLYAAASIWNLEEDRDEAKWLLKLHFGDKIKITSAYSPWQKSCLLSIL